MQAEGATLSVVVTNIRDVASGVRLFELQRADGGDLAVWGAGAHIDVVANPGVVRQYSLCGSPDDRSRWTIAVLREADGRGGSRHLHDQVAPGDLLSVRGPRNNFPLLDAPTYRFVAGGVGITPLLPMIAEADQRGADWHLLYGGRSLDTMAFARDLANRHPDRVQLWPEDECGHPPVETHLATPRPDALVYCCGPEALLAAIASACRSWPDGSLHTERFRPMPPLPTTRFGDRAFTVECTQSGVTLQVPPDRSILDVAEDAGLFVLASCREGTCGSCETPVEAGEVDHRDSVLSTLDRRAALCICVSRCTGDRLVLAL